jgi:hypothetical protein
MNEPVILSSVHPTSLTLQTTRYNPLSPESYISYQLTSFSTVASQNNAILSLQIIITLEPTDLNAVKLKYPLIKDINSIFFSFDVNFVTDFVSNAVEAVYIPQALQCDSWEGEGALTNRPAIVLYSIDLNQAEIKLTFSETVDISTVRLSEMRLQEVREKRFGAVSAMTNSSAKLTLVEGIYMTIYIDTQTLNYMKYSGICYSKATCLLSVTDRFILDYAGLKIQPIWDASVYAAKGPVTADVYVGDSIGPVLERWYIDMKEMVLYVLFNEPVIVLLNQTNTAAGLQGYNNHTIMRVIFAVTSGATIYPLYATTLHYSQYHTHLALQLRNCSIPQGNCNNDDILLYDLLKTQSSVVYLKVLGKIVDMSENSNELDSSDELIAIGAPGESINCV